MMTLSRPSYRRILPRLAAGVGALSMAGFWAGAAGADTRLLDQIHTIRASGLESFVAAERFGIGCIIGGRRLSAVGFNFKQHFSSLVEVEVPAASLAVWNLRYTMGDAALLKEPASRLAHVYGVMEMGDASAGHSDWRSNFAYVRSPVDHRLWAVHWSVNYDGEWTIGAASVPHPDLNWPAGSRFFSAKPAAPNPKTARSNAPVGE